MIQTPPTERRHFSELDGFRALSILAVLAAHMLPLGPPEWRLNTVSAIMGMSVFFVLSGFLITKFLWERPDIPDFLIRRFSRIVPGILAVSVVFCLIVEFRPEAFVAINLYIFNYTDAAIFPGLSPLWSVALEMQFYIGIALAVLLLGRRGFWLVPLAAIAVTGMRIWVGEFSSIRTHLRLDEILSGCLLALLWLNQTDDRLRWLATGLSRAFWPVLVLWALSCFPQMMPLGFARPYLAAGLVGTILFAQETWVHRLLSTAVLRYIAAISFALYIWHSPFRVGWFDAGTTAERYLIKRPLGLAATFVIAHISTFYYERFFTDLARRRGRQVKP